MAVEYLKGKNGHVLAVIRPAGDGSIRIYTPNGVLLGSYYQHNNTTYYPNGSPVGTGNLLAMLV
jgi:antitoxin component YwqK of YwqJK toxin-antitoxin module